MLKQIPTTIITGFLGSGKTTALNHLLGLKPATERWAVLINEFGRVGVDGSLAASSPNTSVREVPGGCLCCTAGIAFEAALNRIVRQSRPDRIIIEPTGIAHPLQVITTLTEGFYRDLLDLRAVLCLVDARNLSSERHMAHPAFTDQLRLADVLLYCKPDLSEERDRLALRAYADASEPPKAALLEAPYGRIGLELLDMERTEGRFGSHPEAHSHRHACEGDAPSEPGASDSDGWELLEGGSHGLVTAGWRIGLDYSFDAACLERLLRKRRAMRVKGVLQCSGGWKSFNGVSGVLEVSEAGAKESSRIEFIDAHPIDASAIDRRMRECLAAL